MRCLSIRLQQRGIEWNPQENYISCMNHVLNLAVQVFLKEIKALPAKEVEAYDLDHEVEDDDEDNHNIELDDDDEGNPLEEIVLNPEAIEEDADYADIGDDFQGTLRKLRGIAKV